GHQVRRTSRGGGGRLPIVSAGGTSILRQIVATSQREIWKYDGERPCYMQAWNGVPERWKRVIAAPQQDYARFAPMAPHWNTSMPSSAAAIALACRARSASASE